MRELLRLLSTGMPETMNCPSSTYLANIGVVRKRRAPPPAPRKCTADKVRHMRELRRDGHTYRFIAEQVGCDPSTARRWLSGRH